MFEPEIVAYTPSIAFSKSATLVIALDSKISSSGAIL